MVDLLCFSDNHGEMPPPSDESSLDAWIFAGDFYNGPEINGANRKDAEEDGLDAAANALHAAFDQRSDRLGRDSK